MITIYCALYPEAQRLIQHYELKKEAEKRHFQVFSNAEKALRLVITGVGAVNAAVAVAEISTAYPPQKEDLLLNFGSSAADTDTAAGSVYLCNKITESASGRTFYPDILYRHPFGEAALTSLAQVKTEREAGSCPCRQISLYDMEGAAVYQAGNFYYGPHQMVFVKIVTDHGVELPSQNHDAVQKASTGIAGADKSAADFRQQFAECMNQACEQMIPYIDELREICGCKNDKTAQQRQDELCLERETDRLAAELHCSVTMRAELAQQLRYWLLAGFDYQNEMKAYYEQGILPCKDKRAGRKILDELERRYL